MQNERSPRSGARAQRGKKDREVLSPVERAAWDRGQALKTVVRAAAALNALYNDVELADAAGIGRGAVGAWWHGSKPLPEHVFAVAEVTGLSADELSRYLHADGPLPQLPLTAIVSDEARAEVAEAEQDLARRPPPPQSPDPFGSGGAQRTARPRTPATAQGPRRRQGP